jgi:glycerol-3-phosphate acyltransferase PlsY
MDDLLKTTVVLSYAYILGSVPMAYVIAHFARGIDLRQVGSGTIGSSNVWYHVGKIWVFPLGIFDVFIKGLTPALLAALLDMGITIQVAAALLAVIGHNWPVFLRFQGGRGIAPIVGVLIFLGRMELAMLIVIGTVGWRLTNSSPVWALIGFVTLPFCSLLWGRPLELIYLMVGLLIITVAKRLASNSRRTSNIAIRELMFNRLIYDRDIRDHDAWVHRS